MLSTPAHTFLKGWAILGRFIEAISFLYGIVLQYLFSGTICMFYKIRKSVITINIVQTARAALDVHLVTSGTRLTIAREEANAFRALNL